MSSTLVSVTLLHRHEGQNSRIFVHHHMRQPRLINTVLFICAPLLMLCSVPIRMSPFVHVILTKQLYTSTERDYKEQLFIADEESYCQYIAVWRHVITVFDSRLTVRTGSADLEMLSVTEYKWRDYKMFLSNLSSSISLINQKLNIWRPLREKRDPATKSSTNIILFSS